MCAYARVRRGEFLFFHNSKYNLVSCSICVARICQLMIRSVPQKRPIVLWKVTCRFMKSDVSFYGKWRVVLWEMTCCFMRNDVLFYEKRRVVLWETTCCFMRNDVLFYEKWRVVLWETTCCFMRNDVLFYEKRRVVLWETTCCFMRNDVLFVQDNVLVVQFYDFALLRVRALFFVRSYRSPLRGRLTTLNNGIKPKSVIRPLLCNLLPRI